MVNTREALIYSVSGYNTDHHSQLHGVVMRQQTLADNGFERFRKQTRREMFLLEMDHGDQLGMKTVAHLRFSFFKINVEKPNLSFVAKRQPLDEQAMKHIFTRNRRIAKGTMRDLHQPFLR